MKKIKFVYYLLCCILSYSLIAFAADDNLTQQALSDLTPEELQQIEQRIGPIAAEMRANLASKTMAQVNMHKQGILAKADEAAISNRLKIAKGTQKTDLEQKQLEAQEQLEKFESQNEQNQADMNKLQTDFSALLRQEIDRVKAERKNKS